MPEILNRPPAAWAPEEVEPQEEMEAQQEVEEAHMAEEADDDVRSQARGFQVVSS